VDRQLVLPQFDKFSEVEGHYIAVRKVAIRGSESTPVLSNLRLSQKVI
jgi:hypothetical protein